MNEKSKGGVFLGKNKEIIKIKRKLFIGVARTRTGDLQCVRLT